MADFSKKAFIVASLRRASYRWPPRNSALRNARIQRNVYVCKKCLKEFPKPEIAIDHKIPVVSLEGFTTWDEYIKRLFCEEAGFQILCHPCHKEKTVAENAARREAKVPKFKRMRK